MCFCFILMCFFFVCKFFLFLFTEAKRRKVQNSDVSVTKGGQNTKLSPRQGQIFVSIYLKMLKTKIKVNFSRLEQPNIKGKTIETHIFSIHLFSLILSTNNFLIYYSLEVYFTTIQIRNKNIYNVDSLLLFPH